MEVNACQKINVIEELKNNRDSTELLNFCKKNGILFEMLDKSIEFNKKQRKKENKKC